MKLAKNGNASSGVNPKPWTSTFAALNNFVWPASPLTDSGMLSRYRRILFGSICCRPTLRSVSSSLAGFHPSTIVCAQASIKACLAQSSRVSQGSQGLSMLPFRSTPKPCSAFGNKAFSTFPAENVLAKNPIRRQTPVADMEVNRLWLYAGHLSQFNCCHYFCSHIINYSTPNGWSRWQSVVCQMARQSKAMKGNSLGKHK